MKTKLGGSPKQHTTSLFQQNLEWFLGKFVYGGLLVCGLVILASLQTASAIALAQGYTTKDKNLKSGMTVSVSKESSGSTMVEAVSQATEERLAGIVVEEQESLVATTTPVVNVYVVTSGEVEAYVSDVAGDVVKGDVLVVSPLDGILMKAEADSTIAVGIALQDLSAVNSQEVVAKDADGKNQAYKVGKIKIDINSGAIDTPPKTSGWLEHLGQSITGKHVSAARVLAALAVFVTLLIIEGSVAYGIVTSSTQAMGRNPLAKKAIRRQSLQNSMFACLVLAVGATVLILILWL